MSKYIDAEKLKKIVEQAMQRALKGAEVDEDLYCNGRADAFEEVLLEIDSLQQEQPVKGLDKARFLEVLDKWEEHAIRGMRDGATAYHQGKIALITDLRDWINREG